MTTVATITPHLQATECPDQLRNLQAWLIWRFEDSNTGGKPRKVPYYTSGEIRSGVHGRPEDRAKLTTFDAARAAAARRGFSGVGFCPLPELGIVAGDFDACVGPDGLDPVVEAAVAGTYAEYSPSGQGVRAFWLGNLGNRKTKAGTGPFGVETFSTNGFVTFTGNTLEMCQLVGAENTVSPISPALEEIYQSRFGSYTEPEEGSLMELAPPLGLSREQIAEALDVLPRDLSYDEWLSMGMAIHHETAGAGFDLWHAWSQSSPKYTNEKYCRDRWKSFGERAGHAPVTARTLLKLAKEHGAHVDPSLADASEFDVVAEATEAPQRFPVVPAAEFSKGAMPAWRIKGILPQAEVVVLFGESGSGKTFAVLDMVMAVARGTEWRGRKTKKGRVVYIAAEGGDGFKKRLLAYAQHHQVSLDDTNFGVIHAAPNFLQKADALDVAKSIAASGGADIVVVDTFAQVMPGGNENAGEDMGKALSHCRGIHRATGAVVILIHHSGKDASKGARGWSGLRGAADAQIEVIKTPGGRLIRIDKQKDGDDQGEWGFDLLVVPVGVDEDGDVVDSCVVVEAALPVMGGKGPDGRRRPLGEWEKRVLEVVNEMSIAQSAGIEIKVVLELVVGRAPAPVEGRRDTRKQHAKRALMALCEGEDAPFWIEDDCLTVM